MTKDQNDGSLCKIFYLYIELQPDFFSRHLSHKRYLHFIALLIVIGSVFDLLIDTLKYVLFKVN
jgi:hypothetical protein